MSEIDEILANKPLRGKAFWSDRYQCNVVVMPKFYKIFSDDGTNHTIKYMVDIYKQMSGLDWPIIKNYGVASITLRDSENNNYISTVIFCRNESGDPEIMIGMEKEMTPEAKKIAGRSKRVVKDGQNRIWE